MAQTLRFIRIYSLFISVCLVALHGRADPIPEDSQLVEWQNIKKAYGSEQRRAVCSSMIDDNEWDNLSLERVVFLYEKALEHLAKAAGYVTKLRPHVEAEVVKAFDVSGAPLVLTISEKRRALMAAYEEAVSRGASELDKRRILEKHAYMACANNKGAILSEKTMLKAVSRLNAQQCTTNA